MAMWKFLKLWLDKSSITWYNKDTKNKGDKKMKTKVYIIENTKENLKVVEEIKNRIPCWVRDTYTADGFIEVEIKCREADVAFVERMLADVV